jgi:hypothetical protein
MALLLGIFFAYLLGKYFCPSWNTYGLAAWDIFCLPAWDIYCLLLGYFLLTCSGYFLRTFEDLLLTLKASCRACSCRLSPAFLSMRTFEAAILPAWAQPPHAKPNQDATSGLYSIRKEGGHGRPHLKMNCLGAIT